MKVAIAVDKNKCSDQCLSQGLHRFGICAGNIFHT